MPRRKQRLAFNVDDRDYDAPLVLELVEDVLADTAEAIALEPEVSSRRAAREHERRARPLPPLAPMPLGALELLWSLDQVGMEPFAARSIELAGGFRPMLERVGLRCDSAEG